jgi:hypothetical protein
MPHLLAAHRPPSALTWRPARPVARCAAHAVSCKGQAVADELMCRVAQKLHQVGERALGSDRSGRRITQRVQVLRAGLISEALLHLVHAPFPVGCVPTRVHLQEHLQLVQRCSVEGRSGRAASRGAQVAQAEALEVPHDVHQRLRLVQLRWCRQELGVQLIKEYSNGSRTTAALSHIVP